MNERYRTDTHGDTPVAYLRRHRIDQTARLLLDTKMTVSDIARQVGFRNLAALHQCWMRQHKIPQRWRLRRGV